MITVPAGAVDGHAATAIALRELGIGRVYGIPGIPVYETFAACVDQGLHVVTTRHQQGAGLMAAAQCYLEGRLSAAALVSSGPAVTNLATALLVARDNGWPLLALAGPPGCRAVFRSWTRSRSIVRSPSGRSGCRTRARLGLRSGAPARWRWRDARGRSTWS